MAPDRPDATGIEATACGLIVTRVMNCGDTLFTLKEGDNASTYAETNSADKQQQQKQSDDTAMTIAKAPSPEKTSIKPSQTDDDLTSLSWLHQQNLLKGLDISSPTKSAKHDNIINNNNNNNNSSNNNNNNNVCEDSAEFSENTNSISSLDDSYFAGIKAQIMI